MYRHCTFIKLEKKAISKKAITHLKKKCSGYLYYCPYDSLYIRLCFYKCVYRCFMCLMGYRGLVLQSYYIKNMGGKNSMEKSPPFYLIFPQARFRGFFCSCWDRCFCSWCCWCITFITRNLWFLLKKNDRPHYSYHYLIAR